jgi:hypothetical protein
MLLWESEKSEIEFESNTYTCGIKNYEPRGLAEFSCDALCARERTGWVPLQ